MRGSDKRSGSLFSYVDLEARVRGDHPLRRIRQLVAAALEVLSPEFSQLYAARMGRPSIAPEMLLRAMLLQAFYSIRSERQLMERLEFDLLFRWFVGLGVDDPAWDHSSFTKNRDRLLDGEIAAKFLAAVLAQPQVKRLLSTDHFSVDGTLIEAWASMKSFKPKASGGDDAPPPSSGGRNAEVDFKGQKRSNETHESATDPEARLYRKGSGMEAKLCFIGHALMENRSGLIVDTRLTTADGHAERIAALSMIEPRAERPRAITLGADKAYDAEDFVNELRSMNVRAHVAQNANGRRSAIDVRTTRHAGYGMSPEDQEAHRGRLRLDQDHCRPAQDPLPGPGQGRMGLRPRRSGLQPGAPAQAHGSDGVSVLGKWRIVELPDYEDDYADMVEPAYILFEATRGKFAFGCVTGAFAGGGEHDAVEFDWDGNDEMDEACGSGWAELQPNGSLQGEINFHRGDDIAFNAHRWPTSSTAC